MRLTTILDQIDMGGIALPEFQRGYVWNRDQVRNLMTSLYRGHPVGSLLVWETQTDQVIDHSRGDAALAAGTVRLLLDGQQRITSLYGLVRGKAPKFFDGNKQAFTGLYFNVQTETFAFHMPTKMDGNPLWVSVTTLMQPDGLDNCLEGLSSITDLSPKLTTCIARLNKITNICNREFHIETVTGTDKTVDEVVDIFNNVNSGGTKLSKGDLALARICGAWPNARDELKSRLSKWEKAGFNFKLDWYLRCITANLTSEANFSALKDVSIDRFQQGLTSSEKAIDKLLNIISSRLGLDHHRVLGSVYAFPLMVRYLDQRGGKIDAAERDQMLYWYVHTLLWGRYSGSVESVLRQDLVAIDGPEGSLDKLIEQLRQNRGNLRIAPSDFGGNSLGNRFYPLLYLLTRVCNARDWEDDIHISKHLLGPLSNLQIHHIFPKSKLYQKGYKRGEVNAIANFTFLTQDTNLKVSNRDPEEYFAHYEDKHPGSLASHWIPMDRALWKYENYPDFLAARRELLAAAANDFLDSLHSGTIPEPELDASANPSIELPAAIPGAIADDAEETALLDCNQWITQQGLPAGELPHELVDEQTGVALAVLDLAWPNGLQEGYSQPVALLLDEGEETEAAANHAGFRFFTDVEQFKRYVEREVLAIAEDEASIPVTSETPEPPSQPDQFKAYIGGYFGDSYTVELQGNSLLYTCRSSPSGASLLDKEPKASSQPDIVVPSAEQWQMFLEALDVLDVWNWQEHYVNPGVLDGTQWSVELRWGERQVKSSGSNEFPTTFKTFRKAVTALLDGREFR